MQVVCIRARLGVEVGDVVEVPDGAEVSDLYYEPVAQEASPPPGPGTIPGQGSVPPASSPASSAPAKPKEATS